MKKLYHNGTVLTMAQERTAEAVLTQNGVILAVGKKEDISAMAGNAQWEDLEGRTLMPAFIDAHSHLTSYANSFLQADLEGSADFGELADRIKRFISENGIRPGEWVIASGYDNNTLKEKRHPLLRVLDESSPQNPLVLNHASGHAGVFNSLALEKLGVTPETSSPEGGRIGRENGTLTGYMEENAFFTYLKKVPSPDFSALAEAYMKAQRSYASFGIATVQEGMMVKQMIPMHRMLRDTGRLFLDCVAYAAPLDAEEITQAFPDAVKRYDGNYKIGGYKIFLDGSPQARTAWMREPYVNGEPGYRGYGTMKDEEVLSAFLKACENKMQLLAHCNGDAAAQQYIDAAQRAGGKADVSRIRPVMIHAQLLGQDQLSAVKGLGIIPSFFVAHVYHWGDTHVINFGEQRASKISPAASAKKQDIPFTFHQDAPVIAPNMLETVWCAANRVTKAGRLLGQDERISVYDALKAVTVNAAHQYFEEDKKGSIEPGKNADFVMLDKNPLDVPAEQIRDIRVIKTIKRDKCIFGC